MSSCWHCNLPPRTASTASGLIINSGRGEIGRAGLLGPSGKTVCVCPALACSPQPVSLAHLPCYTSWMGEAPPARPRVCLLLSPLPGSGACKGTSSAPATGVVGKGWVWELASAVSTVMGHYCWEGVGSLGLAIPWELVRNAESQASPKSVELESTF